MIKYIFLLIIISVVLAGCSEPVIDATTYESQRSSVAKIRDSLSESNFSCIVVETGLAEVPSTGIYPLVIGDVLHLSVAFISAHAETPCLL